MKSNPHSTFKPAIMAMAAATSLMVGSTWGAVAPSGLDIADTPLFLSASLDPNVMFTLDDSGSMQWEAMPDDNLVTDAGWPSFYTFPRVNKVYAGGTSSALAACTSSANSTFTDYLNVIARFDAGNDWAAFFRSPNNNAVYYNPAITYQPWADADGTPFPAADPAKAMHNPVNAALGTRNLTTTLTEKAFWITKAGDIDNDGDGRATFNDCGNHTYYPATYFRYLGGNVKKSSNYQRVEIKPSNSPFTGDGRINRTDCVSGTCNYQQEIQNFANWFQYYRSRVFLARAGVSIAFSEQPPGMRVGYATLNKGGSSIDGKNTDNIVRGVRPFSGADRNQFFDLLFTRTIPRAGTPLRHAMKSAGEYFKRTDSPGPWGATPGSNDSTPQVSCRQSYHILMTDGFWNGGSQGVGDQDSKTGATISAPDGTSFTYAAGSPFADGRGDTLADTAMKYWKEDLRGDLQNRVPSSTRDPGFWQHLVTYGVGLGVFGTVDPDTVLDPVTGNVILAATPTWGNPFNTNPGKIDDLLHAGVDTRGGFFSAANPKVFANRFTSLLEDIVTRSRQSTSLASASTRLETDTLIFQAAFDSSDWSGDLVAATRAGVEKWRVTDPGKIPPFGSRTILSWDGSAGIDFLASKSNTSLMSEIDPNDLNNAKLVVDYVAGDTSNALFRTRPNTVLGDIVNSSPAVERPGNEGWTGLPVSEGGGFQGSGTYGEFIDTTKQTRPVVVFAGANDGMLHAFDASDTGSGGREILAYVPKTVYKNLAQLTKSNYVHKFFVDGTPFVADAYNGSWRSMLVETLGAGGRAVFSLDVTDLSGGVSASNVAWELNGDDNPSKGEPDLGFTIGQAEITRLSNGRWAAIFGNGYNSTAQHAVLFIVDVFSGQIIQKIDTGVGSSAAPNGLASPGLSFSTDANGSPFASAVYAGDLAGNLWKFDISSTNANQWQVDFGGQPLFKAATGQPITSKPSISRFDSNTKIVFFGTGKFFENGDNALGNNPPLQRFYAVADRVDDAGQPVGARPLQPGSLVKRTFSGETNVGGQTFRLLDSNSAAVNFNTDSGWSLDLALGSTSGEQVLAKATVAFGFLLFSTFEPVDDVCMPGGISRIYVLDAFTGTATVFPIVNDPNNPAPPGTIGISLGAGAPQVPPLAVIGSKPKLDTTTGEITGTNSDVGCLPGEDLPVFLLDSSRSVGLNCLKRGRAGWRQRR